MDKNKALQVCLYCLGGAFLLVGVGLSVAWPQFYGNLLNSNLVLSNNSKSYNLWKETPIPMYLDIYLFNCTNAREFTRSPGKVKPVFEEIGPFVFEEVHDRVNVTWNDDGTVSYNQTRRWTFVSESSVPLNASITNLDVVALTVSYMTRNVSPTFRRLINTLFIMDAKLMVTKPANEWLFDGMDDPLLDFAKKVQKWIHIKLPFDKFGFFYQRNMSASSDGRFTILTGSQQLTDLGDLTEWNGSNTTDFYPDTCGHVQGSAGEIFPPTASDQEFFTLFISDVCSGLKLKYARPTSVNGLTGREFVGDETMFGNNASVPEEACFCEGPCPPPGVRNVTLCKQGSPVFVSFPHFYLADKSYTDNVGGMSPNQSLHEFRLALDPATGIPVRVRAQIQVNALLDDYSKFSTYKNVPRIYMPMLWFSQRTQITPDLAYEAILLSHLHIIALPVLFVLAAVGLLMVSLTLWARCRSTIRDEDDDDDEPIIPTPDDEAEGSSS